MARRRTHEEVVLLVCQDGAWHLGGTDLYGETPYGKLGFSGPRTARMLASPTERNDPQLRVAYSCSHHPPFSNQLHDCEKVKNLAWYKITDVGHRRLARIQNTSAPAQHSSSARESARRMVVDQKLAAWNKN